MNNVDNIKSKRITNAFKSVLGSSNLMTVLFIFLFILAFQMVQDEILLLLKDLIDWAISLLPICSANLPIWSKFIKAIIYLIILPGIIVFFFYRHVKKIQQSIIPVITEKEVPKCNILLLFLSPPGQDLTKCDKNLGWLQLDNELNKLDINNKITLEQFQGSWRMPVEAIHYHRTKLDKIIVFVSDDTVIDGTITERNKGTYHYKNEFSKTIKSLFKNIKEPEIIFSEPFDFEKASRLVEEINQFYLKMYKENYTDKDIMIDITGGHKVTTIAGAGVALLRGRMFQYVSNKNYDISYEPELDSE